MSKAKKQGLKHKKPQPKPGKLQRCRFLCTDESGYRLKALVTPSDTTNIFAGHTPTVWRHYLLILDSMLSEDNPLRASTPGVREITPPVMIDSETPHFQLDMGFKLFEDGELTPFLQKRIDRMQMDAKHEQRTLALIDLLHCAGVLEPANVRHQGKKIACYLVNDKALSTNLV